MYSFGMVENMGSSSLLILLLYSSAAYIVV